MGKKMMKKSILILLTVVSSSLLAPAEERHSVASKKADSLKSLQLIIKAEMKQKNRVLILKNGNLTDSLMREAGKVRRDQFESLISDSTVAHEVNSQEDFSRYWKTLESENGIEALKNQYNRADIDKSLVPKIFLFDSSVVVYPGVIILRKRIPSTLSK